jgi:hypothetical protein
MYVVLDAHRKLRLRDIFARVIGDVVGYYVMCKDL